MKTCEHCCFYIPDEIEEFYGVCELTENKCDCDDKPCKRFVEKERK